MGYSANRAIMIATAIFVTLSIASGIIIILSYVLDIYNNVSKIDYSTIVKKDKYQKYAQMLDTEENKSYISLERLKQIYNKSLSEHNMKVLSYGGVLYENDDTTITDGKTFNTNDGVLVFKTNQSIDLSKVKTKKFSGNIYTENGTIYVEIKVKQ